MVPRVQLVLKERPGVPEQEVLDQPEGSALASQVQPGLVVRVPRVLKEKRVRLELEGQVLLDPVEIREEQASLEGQEDQDLVEDRDSLEVLVLVEPLVHLELLECLGRVAIQDSLVHLEPLECLG